MKNVIIVIIVLAGLGVGGLYLKRMKDERDKKDKGGDVQKPPVVTPADTKPDKPKTMPASNPPASDAGAAAAPAPTPAPAPAPAE